MVQKCSFSECNKKILSIAVDCDKCHQFFCATHRMPESHSCSLLDNIKKEAFQNNLENLQKNKINNVNKSLGDY